MRGPPWAFAPLRAMPLDDFMDIANAKLRPQGFKIVVDEPGDHSAAEHTESYERLKAEAEKTRDALAFESEPKAKKAKAKVEETPPPAAAPSNNIEEFPAP